MKTPHPPHNHDPKHPHHHAEPHHAPPPDTPTADTATDEAAIPVAGAPVATPAAEAGTETRLAELQRQVEDFKDKFLRSRADLDNYRKRVQRDLQDTRTAERTATLAPVLQVYDHFLMAQAHAAQASDPATIAEGMRLIADEFAKALTTLGVERIEAAGLPFDPAFHEAVSAENSNTVPAGRVLRQFKPGYRLRDQLLRPAVVVVSNGPAVPAPAPAPQDGPTDTAP